LKRTLIPILAVVLTLVSGPTALAQNAVARSLTTRGEVQVNDPANPTRLDQELVVELSVGPNSNGINPLVEDLSLQIEIPQDPCNEVLVPAGSFVATQNGFVVRDPSQVLVRLIFPPPPNEPNQQPVIVDLTHELVELRIRLVSEGAGQWRLRYEARFRDTGQAPQPCYLPLMDSPESVELRIGDDIGRTGIGRIEFAGKD
jgi:hypothetical protein